MPTKSYKLHNVLPWLLSAVLIVAVVILGNLVSKASKDTDQLRHEVAEASTLILPAAVPVPASTASADQQREERLASYQQALNDPRFAHGLIRKDLDEADPNLDYVNKMSLLPEDAIPVYMVQMTGTTKQILVYDSSASPLMVYRDYRRGGPQTAYVVANLAPVSYGGESLGAISYEVGSSSTWLPAAFTKDGKNIVMCAVMDSRSYTNGSSYGCTLLPLKPMTGVSFYLWKDLADVPAQYLDPRFAYDNMGKSVYTAEGSKTPHYTQPGLGNHAAIIYRDLVSGVSKTILEERDTSYELVSVDETKKTLTFKATTYSFGDGFCGRGYESKEDDATVGDGNHSLDCAKVAGTAERTIALP